MIHLDFAFRNADRQVCLHGWTDEGRAPDIACTLNGVDSTPRLLPLFVRGDLDPSRGRGFLAFLDLPDGTGPLRLDLRWSGNRRRLDRAALDADLPRFADAALDAALVELLHAIATGTARPPDPARLRVLAPRIRAIGGPYAEDRSTAFALDHAIAVAGQAAGFLRGWQLSRGDALPPLSVLCMAEDALTTADLLPASLPRPDLASMADRYRYTGMDGLCGRFALPADAAPPTRVIALVRGEDGCRAVAIPVLRAEPRDLAAEVLLALRDMPAAADPRIARRLMAAAPERAPARASVQVRTVVPAQPVLHVLLDHDLGCDMLRETLSRLIDAHAGRFSVQLLRDALLPPLARAVAGARADHGGAARMQLAASRRIDWARLPDFAGHVLYARSSALLQLDGWRSELAAALSGPCGGVVSVPHAGPGQPTTGRMIADHLPFVAIFEAGFLADAMPGARPSFLTLEGRLRDLIHAQATAGGDLRLRTDPALTLFEGTQAPDGLGCDPHLGPIAHDAALLRLSLKEAA
ncbi:hypothetical protein HMH01_11110 [Halovulum dunhuangense]|uniref:Uncharacterized protein n=1 Tax=Halovulum dunhuangense TaxID=1505036 RepID=A0A849L3S9_9RHOB|nr:hypothetical protein [Halovulum dunhuangense]NNU80985.1 hypothetical protein [Halovulum dunhuangense]